MQVVVSRAAVNEHYTKTNFEALQPVTSHSATGNSIVAHIVVRSAWFLLSDISVERC